jgi:hypothetical protein
MAMQKISDHGSSQIQIEGHQKNGVQEMQDSGKIKINFGAQGKPAKMERQKSQQQQM